MSSQTQKIVDNFWERVLFKFIPEKIVPNHFTIIRFALIPFILFFLALENFGWAIGLFFISALTDSIDGALARKRKQVSQYGIMLDPMADKLLIILSALFLGFYYPYYQLLTVVVAIDVFILIESMVLMFANGDIKVPPANWSGKSKMVFQVLSFLAVIYYLITGSSFVLQFSIILINITIFTGLLSLISYGFDSWKMYRR